MGFMSVNSSFKEVRKKPPSSLKIKRLTKLHPPGNRMTHIFLNMRFLIQKVHFRNLLEDPMKYMMKKGGINREI